MLNLASLLEDSAREVPDRIAVIFNDVKLPYKAVNAAANQIANGLAARGIGKGDKVALSCPNLPFFPLVYYGILKTGATVVPLERAAQRSRNRVSSRRFRCQSILLLPGYARFTDGTIWA